MSIQGMSPSDFKELKEMAKLLEPVIRIGKNGLTDGMAEEIKKQLKKKMLIKIKMLRSFFEGKDKKMLAQEIADKSGAVLLDRVGFVVVLLKKD